MSWIEDCAINDELAREGMTEPEGDPEMAEVQQAADYALRMRVTDGW
jgi:hypothetical protein